MMEMQYLMMRQQTQQIEETNSRQLKLIESLKENDQKKALEELARKNEQALKGVVIEFANFYLEILETVYDGDKYVILMVDRIC